MGKKPARKESASKKGARRLNITPALKADIRRRYETTAESLNTMAADCGCCGETVRAMARREGWVRFEPPPRGLSPAARLRMKAEALSPFVPAQAGTQGDTEEPRHAAPGSPPLRGRTDNDSDPAPDPAVIAAQLLREVSGFLDDVRAERKRMKRAGYAKHELQSVARVIHDCTASLARLQATAQRAAAETANAQQTDQETPYDDMPADLDAFRDALARQIDALLEDAPDEGDRAPGTADEAHPPQA